MFGVECDIDKVSWPHGDGHVHPQCGLWWDLHSLDSRHRLDRKINPATLLLRRPAKMLSSGGISSQPTQIHWQPALGRRRLFWQCNAICIDQGFSNFFRPRITLSQKNIIRDHQYTDLTGWFKVQILDRGSLCPRRTLSGTANKLIWRADSI